MKRLNITNNKRGITLVALIITVIVLLILAMVSIRLIMNGGIINKANHGVDSYADSEINEKINLAYKEYQMGKFSDNQYSFESALQKTGLNIKSVVENNNAYTVTVVTRNGDKEFIVGDVASNSANTEQASRTIYFQKPSGWVGNTVYCWMWGVDGNQSEVYNAEQFPGVAMENVQGKTNIYSYTIPEDDTNYNLYSNVIFTTEAETNVPTTSINIRTNSTVDLQFSTSNINKIFVPTAYSDASNSNKIRIFVYSYFYPAGTNNSKAYVWNSNNSKADWPGETMQSCGLDRYSYIVDRNTYPNIIFNRGQDSSDKNQKSQSRDMTVPTEQDLTYVGYGNQTDGIWGHFLCDGIWTNYTN